MKQKEKDECFRFVEVQIHEVTSEDIPVVTLLTRHIRPLAMRYCTGLYPVKKALASHKLCRRDIRE
jgi:hypothetical protein